MKTNQTYIFSITIWAVLVAAHFFGIRYFYELKINMALGDTLIHFGLLGLLAFGYQYLVKYAPSPDRNSIASIFNLVGPILLVSGLCLALAYAIASIVFKGETTYWEFYRSFFATRVFENLILFTLWVSLLFLFRFQRRIANKELEEAQMQSLLAESRLQTLNSQINPHFLFNSLNSISAQTLSDPEKARKMLTGLSEYLRYTLDSEKESLVSFEKELENGRKYLEIETIRFGKRLEFIEEIDPQSLSTQVPRMLLQPLLENSIKHAVEKSIEPVPVRLKIGSNPKGFFLTLSNRKEDDQNQPSGSGIGLKNLEERLIHFFGKDFSMQVQSGKDEFSVSIQINSKDEGLDH